MAMVVALLDVPLLLLLLLLLLVAPVGPYGNSYMETARG